MTSLGASCKWLSYDSLPSTPGFPPSEGEPTDDEADVFSDPEVDGGKKACLLSDEDVSGPYLRFGPHPLYERDPPGPCPDTDRYPAAAASPELASSLQTPGDLAFAQKCADLHRFIRPLLELLRGLKVGRFDKGLNAFQQSVAIDRLQKILGILQRPDMGEKYLQNLLQIELLLKAWFPQRVSKPTSLQTPPAAVTPHWHQNQLHMPVKKRKLSWLDPRDAGGAKHKQHQQECSGGDPPPAATRLPVGGRRRAGQPFTDRRCCVGGRSRSGGSHSPNPDRHSRDRPATQDSSVSSSDCSAAAVTAPSHGAITEVFSQDLAGAASAEVPPCGEPPLTAAGRALSPSRTSVVFMNHLYHFL